MAAMVAPAPHPAAFMVHGPVEPVRPVVIAIPHAGRFYPPAMMVNARVTPAVLERLEDRHVDALAAEALAQRATAIMALVARAYVDLNRAEDEWDSESVSGAETCSVPSARVRGGLGLVPQRLHPAGNLWRDRINHAELSHRLDTVHRPYHAAIAAALDSARNRFGHAVLIDLHSMPVQPGGTPQFVIGDRHGGSAGHELVDRLLALAEGHGLSVARNAPYAGAYGVIRHGRPARGIEAVQVEFDRSLYLDTSLEPDPARVAPLARLVAGLVAVAQDHALARSIAGMAAE
jgi:N-formylglutamate amidohydrolase